MPTIYLSSTNEDLKEHCQVVEALPKTGVLADGSGSSVDQGNPNG